MRLIDIAKRLRISHSTVSRALNPDKRHLISEDVREKVLALAARENYRPSRPARALRKGTPKSVGLILPTAFNSLFFNEQIVKIMEAVYEELKDNRYGVRLLVLPAEGDKSGVFGSLTDDLAGLLVSSQCDHGKESSHYLDPALVRAWQKPMVVLNLEVRRSKNVSVVTFSNFDAARQAMKHLIKTKRRRIALIYGDKRFEDSAARYEAYEHTLKEHYIPINRSWIVQGNYSQESGYQATLKLFRGKEPRPDGIFCTNDEMAMGAIRALQSLRIACPREVSVMGFDGLAAGALMRPRLSTVAQPTSEMTKAALRLLIRLMEEKEKGPQTKVIPSKLILRESA